MDPAVALVRAYLNFNGFFSVVEYPVVEEADGGGFRPTTDLDILAVRFNNSGHYVHSNAEGEGRHYRPTDPELALGETQLEFIIGEVKQGTAELNRGAREPAVLRAALTRFGAFNPESVDTIVERLIREGQAKSKSGWARVRLFAFGSSRSDYLPKGVTTILHAHMIDFLRTQYQMHADKLSVLDLKDEALGMLALLSKSRAWRQKDNA